jgi:hypothetical protein
LVVVRIAMMRQGRRAQHWKKHRNKQYGKQRDALQHFSPPNEMPNYWRQATGQDGTLVYSC